MSSIGDKIRDLRKNRGLTQEQLAKLLGVSKQMIGKWETGKSNPKIQSINKLAQALDVYASALIDIPGSSVLIPTESSSDTHLVAVIQVIRDQMDKYDKQMNDAFDIGDGWTGACNRIAYIALQETLNKVFSVLS